MRTSERTPSSSSTINSLRIHLIFLVDGLRLRRCEADRERKGASFFAFSPDPDAPAHHVDESLCYVQAEPCTADLADFGSVHARELAEHLRHLRWGHPDSAIRARHVDLIRCCARRA